MKRKHIISILFFFVLNGSAFAINEESDTTFWRAQPEFISIERIDFKNQDAYIFEDNRFVYYSTYTREVTRHTIIYLNTQQGLEDNNKVVIYVPGDGSITELKARSINKNGAVVELNQQNIKEVKSYNENGNLKLFAIEGAERGGQIEYTYTIQTPVYSGGMEEFSKDYETRHAYALIKSQKGMQVAAKLYNWENKTSKHSNKQSWEMKNILPIREEQYAVPDANKVFVMYTLTANGDQNYIYKSYEIVSRFMFPKFRDFLSAETSRAVSLLNKYVIESNDEEAVIRSLDVFFKKNYFYTDDYAAKYGSPLSIMNNGLGNDDGLARLFCLMLTELDIEHNIIITCSKYDNWLDPKFCSPYYLDEYVIYFPQHETYLYPAAEVCHYGLIPYWLEGNNGLLLSEYDAGLGNVIELPSQHPDSNRTSLTIDIELDEKENSSIFKIEGYGTGQVAYELNSDYYYSESDEEKKEALEDHLMWRYPDDQLLTISMINPQYWGDISWCNDYSCRRSYMATVQSSTFFERAGDKLLINIGRIIGPQNELYKESVRIQPITCDYNKSYSFDISLTIPDGYKYVGNQNVEIDNVFEDKSGERVAGFKSTLEIAGNKILIKIYESYARVNMDKSMYEDYRRIINSAADFNKAAILLEKI